MNPRGSVRPDGRGGTFVATCGGCLGVTTLPRTARTPEAARRGARADRFDYMEPWGWLCPSCIHGWGVDPRPELPRQVVRRGPICWRTVRTTIHRPRDRSGRVIAARGEVLSCGHIVIPRDGTAATNRRRRCLDCEAPPE